MILVRNIDGEWRLWAGATLAKTYTTANLHYNDGRIVEIEVDPYRAEEPIDAGRVGALLAEGIWTEADLERYGLRMAEPFAVPEGKITVGEARYVEKKGKVYEQFDLQDAPPPPPEPSRQEKLEAMLDAHGLSLADLKEALVK